MFNQLPSGFFKVTFISVSPMKTHLACMFESILPHKVYENMFVEDDDGGSEQTGPL